MDYAIDCRGVSKVLGGRKVIDGIDLRVPTGEVFGFLGPNGAGKTTTIRMLLGLSRVDEGEAFILGSRVPAPVGTLRHVGCMIEEPSFYPWMTGASNLKVLLQDRLSKKDIYSALERAGIAHAMGHRVRTYSQGMRQRLAVALAICGKPQLLILDEPANGLDPAGIREMRVLVREMAAQGTTVFLSSHLLGEVERACDRVEILHRGKVVAEGTISELGGSDQSLTVTVASQEREAALAALRPMNPRLDDAGRICISGASGGEVTKLLAAASIYPEAVSLVATTLEERFLSLTEDQKAPEDIAR